MKKLLAILLAVVLVFSFAACGSSSWEADMKEYEELVTKLAEAKQAGEDTEAIEAQISEMDDVMSEHAEKLEGDELEEFKDAAMEMYQRLTSKYGDLDF